jgi:hypothetical protein
VWRQSISQGESSSSCRVISEGDDSDSDSDSSNRSDIDGSSESDSDSDEEEETEVRKSDAAASKLSRVAPEHLPAAGHQDSITNLTLDSDSDSDSDNNGNEDNDENSVEDSGSEQDSDGSDEPSETEVFDIGNSDDNSGQSSDDQNSDNDQSESEAEDERVQEYASTLGKRGHSHNTPPCEPDPHEAEAESTPQAGRRSKRQSCQVDRYVPPTATPPRHSLVAAPWGVLGWAREKTKESALQNILSEATQANEAASESTSKKRALSETASPSPSHSPSTPKPKKARALSTKKGVIRLMDITDVDVDADKDEEVETKTKIKSKQIRKRGPAEDDEYEYEEAQADCSTEEKQSSQQQSTDTYGLVGRPIVKKFDGVDYEGVVASFRRPYFRIQYTDGDEEEMGVKELKTHLFGCSMTPKMKQDVEEYLSQLPGNNAQNTSVFYNLLFNLSQGYHKDRIQTALDTSDIANDEELAENVDGLREENTALLARNLELRELAAGLLVASTGG